ncbi:Target of rapamycin complex 1 subunit mip1 [Psilocybe cubensis]|uniref:Raptor N-terminal CASPase-like domain-containing protein n=2 Tax=Psilocybe cubensis TaxID=181762 RepID=A0A8H7Y4J1_PSICU|nr:Target of rapamycin complex 1 subunit mip1 [Psilocybe cubensis]KAH9486204.1 Target of rapamycin complex 1 subunit mip1 [Psilocybe cubensis]
MSTSQQQLPPRNNGPKFTTGTTRWPRVNGSSERTGSSDSDTERDFRSASRSDPSSRSRTHHSRGPHGRRSPDHRAPASIETAPDAPAVPYWSGKRHLTCGNPTPGPPWSAKNTPWRGSAPGKLKTSNAVLIICLNIGVDPPDIVKTDPCAMLECWVDPHSMPAKKALEAIGTNLQHQFEGLSTKISYKPILDPEIEELRRFCIALRKQSKEDAVVFYYNGHGVPKPTSSGELWCFNKDYTQYIPISIQEVQSWIGSPGVYIWDCSAAGNLLHNFNVFAEKRDNEIISTHGGFPEGAQPMMNSLQLAACGANETLPTCPELPADVFTSCLTSPIDIALRYFIMNHQLPNNITQDMVTQLPGDLKDRRTPLGELNWIFTAITDTIAWTTFSRETFTRLYRCDLLIASIFRNFLLAERIMKDYHCTPHTYPPLPATNTHPLWATWDLAVDACLRQLPDLLTKPGISALASTGTVPGRIGKTSRDDPAGTVKTPEKPYVYVPSRFFADQLTAFEVWISRGGSALTRRGPLSLPQLPSDNPNTQNQPVDHDPIADRNLVPRKPPDQLPIVLQVLLSQPHRLRALILLSQFVDLGPWAVHLVLTIGIFPYISKLLQAAGQDLRPVLIFIWARIIAVDSSVQTDLYNTQGFRYFSNILSIRNEDNLPNSSEHKAMCSFILASIARDFPQGQIACLNERVFDNCYELMEENDFLLRQWTTLCIAQLWDGNDEIKVWGVDRGTQDKLIGCLSDVSAEVRSAVLYALGTFLGASGSADPNRRGGGGSGPMSHLEEFVHFKMEVAIVTGATLAIKDDASPMCRKELLVLISCLVKEWRGYFVICAWLYWEEDRKWRLNASGHHSFFNDEDITNQAVADWLEGFGDDHRAREENRVVLSSFFTVFVSLLDLSVDPYEEVATNAQTLVDYIMALLLESPFSRMESSSLNSAPMADYDKRGSPKPHNPRTRVSSLQSSPNPGYQVPPSPGGFDRPGLNRNDSVTTTLVGGVASTIKRTSSFANALKQFAGGIAFPHSEDGRSSPSISGTLHHHHHEAVDISRPPSPNMNLAKYTSPYSRPPSFRQSASDYDGSPTRSAEEQVQPPAEFLACDVMEALMEEDLERLRARRRSAYQRGHGRGSIPSPSNSTFSMDSTNSSVILGIGTGAGIHDCLPLKSTFFDWCAEYFKEPQMRQTEADEPGSTQYNYQVWRQQRNDQVIKETDSQASMAEHHRWDRSVASINISGHPMTMAFHSYDKHLVIANEHDMISVWDWHTRRRLNYFCNGNPRGTSITGLHIINQEIGGIIVTGSADGIVRLYRNYDPTLDQGPLQMVSAFRGLNEMIQSRQGSGLVMDWKQSGGLLLVGGDSRVIKVWDASTEQQGLDLDTNSESPVTSIAHDIGSSKMFVAGFADGVVKVFDGRLEEEDAIVRTYSDHTSWVQNVRWHPTLNGQILSAGIDGEVKLFDLRSHDYALRTWNLHPNGLSAFDVHPTCNVFAANSTITPVHWKSQRIVVQSINKTSPLCTLNVGTGLTTPPVRGLPSPFFPRASSLVFHPTEMLYATGGPDGCVRILGCHFA